MIQVNLLPRQVLRRQRTRRVTAVTVLGAGAALVLLGFVFFLQVNRLSSAKHELAVQQATNTHLQTTIDGLQRFAQLKQDVSDRQATVIDVTQGQVMWSGVLKDLSTIVPSQLWLTQLTGTVSGSDGASGTGSGAGIVGSIQFQGTALNQPTVAQWLTRLEKVDGWVNSWVTSSAKAGDSGLVQFSGSVDLTKDATSSGRQV